MVILGIGNELREDDNVGPYVIEKLNEFFEKKDLIQESVILINAGSVPENFTGIIKKEAPSHLIIIDTVLMDNNPGTIKFIKKENIANTNISTHSLSLNFLINYLEKFLSIDLLFIGIQPLKLSLGNNLSEEVKKSADELISIISSLLTS
ncbi:MAG: hydrogenase maturation peptidase HycI [Methanobrevibacter sp.]|nr:hydrogenase maturation peptidase HycI [Methanobrevibacter sp.]